MWFVKKQEYKSDEELLAEFEKTGNKALFAELFKKHVKTVYGTCLFYLQDKAEAQDATMQLFEKLLLEANKHTSAYLGSALQPTLRAPIKNFKGWLSFVVRNHCISIIRKNKTSLKNQQAFYEFEYAQPNEEEENTMSRVGEERLLEQMKESLPKLKEAQRHCVELFYLQQQSYQQIAAQTNYNINEVKSHIQNGKRNLKLLIEQHK